MKPQYTIFFLKSKEAQLRISNLIATAPFYFFLTNDKVEEEFSIKS